MGSGLLSFRRTARNSSRAQLFFLLVLAAFVFQTAVLRAHIHAGTADGSVQLASEEATASKGKHSPTHNEADCPLWHASSNGTAGIVAAATALPAPLSETSRATFDERNIFPERFAAAWRSRAPPISLT
jgi:hypothetical protein